MISRINSDDDRLSSIANLYVGLSGYYDWINTSTHAFEISFLPSLYGRYDGQNLDLGLLQTPYRNDPPYDTYLLSVNPNGSPGQDEYAAGKYRSYKWLVMGVDGPRIQHDLSTYRDSLQNGSDQEGWYVNARSYEHILEGHYQYVTDENGYITDTILCSTFDWWPGQMSKRQYDDMWKNFIIMAWGGRDLKKNPSPSMVYPPLYDPSLQNFGCFDTYNDVWDASEAQGKAKKLFDAFGAELRNAYGSDWTRACSMNIHHFGKQLFEYGQLNDGVSRYRTGIVSPLLGFIDFLYGTNYSTFAQLDDILTNSKVEPISARLCYPELLSACAVTQLSSPYMGFGGVGVDENCSLFSQNINGKKGDHLDFYETNPKMSYANYVALCDFYRSFCTMEEQNNRHHVRFGVTQHKWSMEHIQVDRECQHNSIGQAVVNEINEDEGYADVVIDYDHTFSVEKDLSSYKTFDNHIETVRRQNYNYFYDGGGLAFNREFQIDLSNYCIKDPVKGLVPNPELDAETQAWVERLFPPNPEPQRDIDIQELTEKYDKEVKQREDQISTLSVQLEEDNIQYDIELQNSDIQCLTGVFTHFSYPVPQPVPHYPEVENWWDEWFYPGVQDVISNDPTLSSVELKDEREREMMQYTDDIINANYSEGGEGYEIDMKWQAIFDNIYAQIDKLEKEIDALTQKYQRDRAELEAKEYEPQLPSREDQLKILQLGLKGTGPVVQSGNGYKGCIASSRMRAVAPLSGLYGRVFEYDYDGNPISSNLNYWPAPIVMLGPEKEHILVREWLPYKVKFYSGQQPTATFEDPDLSNFIFAGSSGINLGIGQNALTNDARDNDQFNVLKHYCPRYWSSKGGNLDYWLGKVPDDLQWPENHSENQRVQFTEPTIGIIVSKDMIGGPPKKQKLVLFNGEQRSDLRVAFGGTINTNMSELLTGITSLGYSTIGAVTYDLSPRPKETMMYWNQGPDYDHLIYDQCTYMLRSARFTLH